MRTALTAINCIQAAILIVAGCATLWWSESLMFWLISIVGEERALGADNAIHTENGGKLLTNPGAMGCWTIPFLVLGLVQISAGCTLLWESYKEKRR